MLTQKQASPFKNKSPSAMRQPEQRGCKCWQSTTIIPLTSRHFASNRKILWSIISEFCPLGFWYVNALQQKPKKTPENRSFPGKRITFLSLAELRCATGGFEAVFKQYFCLFLCIYKAFRALSCCFPLRVNPSIYRLFSIVMRLKSLVYYRCQFPRFIILNLCVNVHRHLAVLVTG